MKSIVTNVNKYLQQVQLTLFLKELGLPVHDALLLWKREYSIPATTGKGSCQHGWRGNEGRYIYNIRHLYGLEGSRIDYKAHRCSAIQERSLTCGDVGGCPFASLDKASLITWLSERVTDVSSIEIISHSCQAQQYGQACQQFMRQRLSQTGRARQRAESLSSHSMLQPDSPNTPASGTLENRRQSCSDRSVLQTQVRNNRQTTENLPSGVNKLVNCAHSDTQASGCVALSTENQRLSHTSQLFQSKRIKQTPTSLSSHVDISTYSESKSLSSYAHLPSCYIHANAQTSESERWNERSHNSYCKHTVAPYQLTYESSFCSSVVSDESVDKRTHQVDHYEVTFPQSHQSQAILCPSFHRQEYHSSGQTQSGIGSDYHQESKQFHEPEFESSCRMDSKMRCHTCDLKTKELSKSQFTNEYGINSETKCQNHLYKSCGTGASYRDVSDRLCHKCDCLNLKSDCIGQKCFCQCNKSEHSSHKTDHPDKTSDSSGHRSDCFNHRPDCSCHKSNNSCHKSYCLCNKSDCPCHVSDFSSKLSVDLRKMSGSERYKDNRYQQNKLDKTVTCCLSVTANVTAQTAFCDMSHVTTVSCQSSSSSTTVKVSENGTGNLTTNGLETATSVVITKTSQSPSDSSAVSKKRSRSQLGQMKEGDGKDVKETRDCICIPSDVKKKRLVTSQNQTDVTTSSFSTICNLKSVSYSKDLLCPCCRRECSTLLRALLPVPQKPVDSVVDLRLVQHVADKWQNTCTCARKCGNTLSGFCGGEIECGGVSNGQSSLIGGIITDSSKGYDRKRGNVSDSHGRPDDDLHGKEVITRSSSLSENHSDTGYFDILEGYSSGAVQVGSGKVTRDETSVDEVCSDKCDSSDVESDSNSDDLFSDTDGSPMACSSPLSHGRQSPACPRAQTNTSKHIPD